MTKLTIPSNWSKEERETMEIALRVCEKFFGEKIWGSFTKAQQHKVVMDAMKGALQI